MYPFPFFTDTLQLQLHLPAQCGMMGGGLILAICSGWHYLYLADLFSIKQVCTVLPVFCLFLLAYVWVVACLLWLLAVFSPIYLQLRELIRDCGSFWVFFFFFFFFCRVKLRSMQHKPHNKSKMRNGDNANQSEMIKMSVDLLKQTEAAFTFSK